LKPLSSELLSQKAAWRLGERKILESAVDMDSGNIK